jgi:hypothetical protein
MKVSPVSTILAPQTIASKPVKGNELRESGLRKWLESSTIHALSIRFQFPFDRHVRQAKVTRDSALRQELRGHGLGET